MESDRAPIVDEMETEHSETAFNGVSNPNVAVSSRSWDDMFGGSWWNTFRASLNTLVYTLIGGSVLVTCWFAFKRSHPTTPFTLHVVFCMIGYQFLMAHAILCLQSHSWGSPLNFTRRRRAHWILQLVGSVLAFVGSVIMMAQKTVNFNTLHGKFALAALIFTVLSLLNGLTSLYTVEFRRYISPTVSKLSHLAIGTAAFTMSSICLIYGYLKGSFIGWSSDEFSYAMIAITCVYTSIIISVPCITIWKRLYDVFKNKIF